METANAVYERSFVPETCQSDPQGRWRIGAVLEAMQITANDHCRALRVWRDELGAKGLLWVLFRTDLRLDRYPCVGETVVVRTFTKAGRMKFIPRYFTFTDARGERFGAAGSLWMMIDRRTRASVSPAGCGFALPDAAEIEAPIRIGLGEKPIAGRTDARTYAPQYTDLDANGHVGNIRYIDWLCNHLGPERMTRCEIADLSVVYRQEVRCGDPLVHTLTLADGGEFGFDGSVGDRQVFGIRGRLRSREPELGTACCDDCPEKGGYAK